MSFVSIPKPTAFEGQDEERDERDESLIDDLIFIRDLKRLKDLRSFLIQEAGLTEATHQSGIVFGQLNLLSYDEKGRAPTEDEWQEVELHTQQLFRYLTPQARRRFVLGGIPSWLATSPLIFAVVAFASLIIPVVYTPMSGDSGATVLPFYLLWLISLGAIGSVASIGMNALSVQEDATFDLTNPRLMILRIGLGSLFAVVITLPFGFGGFYDFLSNISHIAAQGGSNAASPQSSTDTKLPVQALLLLLPFVLGFSTSLVILLLNRLVQAAQAFFGLTQSTADRSSVPPLQPVRAPTMPNGPGQSQPIG